MSLDGKVAWCSNGTLEWYLEGMRDEATRTCGPTAPITRHVQESYDARSMGQILFLDALLTDVEETTRFRQVFETVAADIASRVDANPYASRYQQDFAAEVRAMLGQAIERLSSRR